MNEGDYADFAVESPCEECLYCIYGEIPEGSTIPFSLCWKHLDVATFILDKANLHPRIVER